MEKQVIFEYRVSGFYTDAISTQEKDMMQENAKANQQWSLSQFFSWKQDESNEIKRMNSLPWHISLESNGNFVAFLQTGVISIYDYETSQPKFFELPSSFCNSPEKRKLKWSPCSKYLFVFSSDQKLLILSNSCEQIGILETFGSQPNLSILDFFPFDSMRKSNSNYELYFHVLYINGDCITMKIFKDLLDDEFEIEILCKLKQQFRNSSDLVETACYLPKSKALIMTTKINKTFSESFQNSLKCVQYTESSTSSSGQSLTTVPFYSHYLLNQSENQLSQPFLAICHDPSEKNFALLHSSGRISLFRFETQPSPHVTDIAELQNFTLLEQSCHPIAAIHFLSDGVLLMISAIGEIMIRSFDWIQSSQGKAEKQQFSLSIVNLPVESIPPVLGKSVSSSIVFSTNGVTKSTPSVNRNNINNGSTDKMYSRVSILRIVDPWTCQIFTLTNVSPQRALQTKIKEGYFSSAYHLADQIGVDSDIVALAEWNYHQSNLERLLVLGNPTHSLPESGHAYIVSTYLTKIQSLNLLMDEILNFTSVSTDLWINVILEGLRRTQVFSEAIADSIDEYLLKKDFQNTSLLNLVDDRLRVANIKITDPTTISSIVYFRRLLIEKYLKLLTVVILKEHQIDLLEFKRYLNFQTQLIHSLSDTQLILQTHITIIAKFLLQFRHFNLFKMILSYYSNQLLPVYFELLAHIPISVDPLEYLHLIPIPFEEIQTTLSFLTPPPPTTTTTTTKSNYQWNIYFTQEDYHQNHHHSSSNVSLAESFPIDLERKYPNILSYANDISSWDVVVNSLCPTPAQNTNLPILHHVDLQSTIGINKISHWILHRIFRIESFGQTSHSITLLKFLIKYSSLLSSTHLSFIQELFLHIQHFSTVMYHQLCPVSLTFIDWIQLPYDERMRILFDSSLQLQSLSYQSIDPIPSIDFVDVINLYINSIFLLTHEEKNDKSNHFKQHFFSSLSCTEFIFQLTQYSTTLKECTQHRIDGIINHLSTGSQWENYLIKELVLTVQSNSNSNQEKDKERERKNHAMENLCRVVDNSKPGIQESQKCIKKLPIMLELVIKSCRAYNIIDRIGLDYMWRMIESTPQSTVKLTTTTTTAAGEAGIGVGVGVGVRNDHQYHLDQIQSALSVGEILCEYFPENSLPTLNALIPVDGFHRHEQQIYRMKFLKGVQSYASGLSYLLHPSNTTIKIHEKDEQDLLELGHAIILSMCSIVLQKSNCTEEDLWIKLCIDLEELRRLLYSNIPSIWIGCIVLQYLVTDTNTAVLFIEILKNVLNSKENETLLVTHLCGQLGVTPSNIYSILFNKIHETINSASSCFDHDLIQYQELFQTILTNEFISQCEDQIMMKQLENERNLLSVIRFIQMIGNSEVDFPPLQLRLTSVITLVNQILKISPTSYMFNEQGQQIDGVKFDSTFLLLSSSSSSSSSSAKKSIYEQDFLDDESDENDSLTRQFLLSQKQITGKYFITIFSLLSSHPLDQFSIYLEVIRTALQLDYLMDAIDLCLDLSTLNEFKDSKINNLLFTEVIKQILTALDQLHEQKVINKNNKNEDDDMNWFRIQQLKTKLTFSFITNCPINELIHATHLIQFSQQQEMMSSNGSNLTDMDYINQAKSLLWQVVGEILYRPCSFQTISDQICSVAEIVTLSYEMSATGSIIGYLLLVNQKHLVIELFESILKDLKSKIAKSVRLAGKRNPLMENNNSMIIPLDNLISQVQAKGFHRNSAYRAVVATKNESLEAALKWAIEHSNDPDFTEPVVFNSLTVIGALKKNDTTPSISLEDLNLAIQMVSAIERSYQLACHNHTSGNDDIHVVESLQMKQFDEETTQECDSQNTTTPSDSVRDLESSTNLEKSPKVMKKINVNEENIEINEKNPLVQPSSSSSTSSVEVMSSLSSGNILSELSKATALINTLHEKIAHGEVFIRSGVNTDELARNIVFWDVENLEEEKRRNMEGELISFLLQLSFQRSEESFSLLHEIVLLLPNCVQTSLLITMSSQHETFLSTVLHDDVSADFVGKNTLIQIQDRFNCVDVDPVTLLMRIFSENKILSYFYSNHNILNLQMTQIHDFKKDISLDFLFYLKQTPFRLFTILSFVYCHVNGKDCDQLYQIKKVLYELISHLTLMETSSSSTSSPSSSSSSDPLLNEVKNILQDDLATIKRINRMQPNDINIKRIFQSDHILPLRYFDQMASEGAPRDLALKEISRHLSSENISQWNRTIGRFLDTGLSELGLHFSLEKSVTLTRLLKELSPDQMGDIEYHVKEYLTSISTVVVKLRYEHFHLLVLYLSCLSYDTEESIGHLHVDKSLYPIDFPPSIVIQILSGFLRAIQGSGHDQIESKIKEKTMKSKTILKKLDDTKEIIENTPNPSSGSLDSSMGINNPSVTLLKSILDFFSLFLLFPDNFHSLIRESYSNLMKLQELSMKILLSLDYSVPVVSQSFLIISHHSITKLKSQLPVEDILSTCVNTLLLQTNTTSHLSPSSGGNNWDLIFHKFNSFLQVTNSLDRDCWNEWMELFLCIEPTQLHTPKEEYQNLFLNRYEVFQSLVRSSPTPLNISIPTIEKYFTTHIFLFSDEILEIVPFDLTSNDKTGPILPFPMASFSSPESLHQLFLQIKEHLSHLCSLEAPQINHQVIMILLHLLRSWGWGGQISHSKRFIQDLFEFWTNGTTTTTSTHKQIVDNDPSSSCSSSSSSSSSSQEIQLDCFLKLLELCSQHALEEEFLDIVLLDILSPIQREEKLKYLSSSLYSTSILQLTINFKEEFVAWIRLYHTAYVHGGSSEAVQNEAISYLDILEKTNQYENNFYLSLLLLLPIASTSYHERKRIFSSLVTMTFNWLEKRIDSHLESTQDSMEANWKMVFIQPFLNDLSTSKSSHLPMLLSPISLVFNLIKSNYLIDASNIYWKILQLPRSSFRNDVAYTLLHNSLLLQNPEYPFYLTCLPEIESHEWGW